MIAEGTLVGGRYRLDRPIGHGHAGIVWQALDTGLHRTVAVKRMYIPREPDPARAREAGARALREAREACRVSHNCAIGVYDALPDGDDVWLIMEYVPSRSMDEFLHEYGTLSPEHTATLGAQLGSALTVAHSLGIAHGSLEPANVLLADDGGVKITDIGFSAPGPSPAYRAPELARGGAPGPASDAFSLGCTLYAAVEGVPPFGAEGTADQASPHHAGVLTGALLKLLRAEPDMRPTMRDTVTALEAIGGGNDVATVPPTAPPGTPTPQRPHVPHTAYAPQRPADPAPVQQAPAPAPPTPRPAGTSTRRTWMITALAIVLAVAVGILFTEFVIL